MRNKRKRFLSLLCLFVLAAAAPVLAAPQDATLSDASAEDVIEYEDPEGLVHLEPKFEWTGEDRFLLSFRVSNRTDVLIPETEMVMQFSGEEDAGVFFDGSIRAEPEEYPGTALLTGGQQVLTVLLTDLQPGDDYRFYAEGSVPKESSLPDIQASLILRGYGLEHSTESRVEVPDRAAEEPEEEITVLLVVRLLENGKEGVPAQFAYLYKNSSDIYIQGEVEQASRRMHFLPYAGEAGSRSMSFPVLASAAVCVMLSTFALMNHFLVKRAMRLKEAGKAG